MPTQLEIDKRRALAKALLAQQMPQGQQAGRFYVAPSPWAQALSGITNAVGQYQGLKADSEQGALDKDNQRKIAEALAMQGTDPATQAAVSALPPEQQRALLGQITATKLAPKPVNTRPPVTIRRPDGKPEYANPDDAIGKEPYLDAGQRGMQGAVGNFNPGDYSPDSLQAYLGSRTDQKPLGDISLLKRYSAPIATVRNVENVPTFISGDRTGGNIKQTPLSTLPDTAAAAGALKSAESEGAATGKATGEAKGAIQKKGIESGNVIKLLDQADALVPLATGSGIGSIADSAAGFFGASPAGAQAAAELKVIGANLVLGLPRLEGPQSDRDTALYKEAAAQLGDDTVPAATKKAALQTVRAIQEQYKEQFEEGTGASNIPAGSVDVQSLVEKYRTRK